MIPFVDLKRQYQSIKGEIDAALLSVLDSTQFVLGAQVEAFEAAFASYCGVEHAVALNSGTSALHLALLVAGIGPGDEVITTPLTFVATTAAIIYTGATPVLVDVDPVSRNIDPALIERKIRSRTKAIVPVHLHGLAADMAAINEIAARHNLVVIEDAAQAHGATDRGLKVGGLGALGCFSFYPGKNLGAYGEGGAVVTSDAEFARKLRMYRDWGQDGKYNHVLLGYNYRMDGIQGAILRVKMNYIEAWTEARRARAGQYDRGVDALGLAGPAAPNHARHVYHVYAIEVDERDNVAASLQTSGIHTSIHYPIPVHLQAAYKHLGYRKGDFPVAERLAMRLLSLPLYAELAEEEVAEVLNGLRAALER